MIAVFRRSVPREDPSPDWPEPEGVRGCWIGPHSPNAWPDREPGIVAGFVHVVVCLAVVAVLAAVMGFGRILPAGLAARMKQRALAFDEPLARWFERFQRWLAR